MEILRKNQTELLDFKNKVTDDESLKKSHQKT